MAYVASKLPIPGPSGLSIIRSAVEGGFYLCETPQQVIAANKANGNGYLAKDARNGKLFYPTDRAAQLLDLVAEREVARVAGEADLAISNPQALATINDFDSNDHIVSRAEASDLVQTILRAQRSLDDGDVIAAKQLAGGAYLDAKARVQYAASFGEAGKRVIAKVRQLQADALEVETLARIQIAAAYDAAQADGRAHKGRPKSISDGNTFTLAEAGLSAKEIHDARKLAAAEKKAPGLIKRTIAARLEVGLEPSRANLRAAVGTASAPKADRGDNFYQTPIEAMRTLIALESFTHTVLDPACGLGASSRPLEQVGYDVVVSDLVDRNYVTLAGAPQMVGDFLLSEPADADGDRPDICSNPPYGEVLNAFVAHALRVHRPRKMALLLNLNFQCGFADDDRNFVMDENPPARIYVFKRRLPMMHREGYNGPKSSSRMNTAWFIWELQDDGTYGDVSVTRRVDWAEFQDVDAIEPGEGGHASAIAFRESFERETPRKSLDERVDEERARALIWAGDQESFDAIELRRGIAVRPSTADALIEVMQDAGHIRSLDDADRWVVTEDGWLVLKAMAGMVLSGGTVGEVAA